MSVAWVTSDLHIGHAFIAGLRGFDDVLEHDAWIARTWRNCVQENDVVWVLGDISSGTQFQQREALFFLSELPGTKYLVAGNHDGAHPLNGRAARKWTKEYGQAFDYVCSQACMNIEGIKMMMSHFPYAADHSDVPRYSEWRLKDCGLWLLHGHTHSQNVWTPQYPREYHVGWDAHQSPVNLATITQFIQEKNDEANHRANSSLSVIRDAERGVPS